MASQPRWISSLDHDQLLNFSISGRACVSKYRIVPLNLLIITRPERTIRVSRSHKTNLDLVLKYSESLCVIGVQIIKSLWSPKMHLNRILNKLELIQY